MAKDIEVTSPTLEELSADSDVAAVVPDSEGDLTVLRDSDPVVGALEPDTASPPEEPELPDVDVDTEDEQPEEEPEYVHVPGTVHLNAFVGAVELAKNKLAAAQAEFDEAERALENKKTESGLL